MLFKTFIRKQLWYLQPQPQGEESESVPYLQTEFDEGWPDGKFVAYCSNESGRYEVYVRPFPDGGEKWQVTTEGGRQPRWGLDGKELFYVDPGTRSLMSVAVVTTPSFDADTPKRLFTAGRFGGTLYAYDVSADGERFVTIENIESDNAKPLWIHVVGDLGFDRFQKHLASPFPQRFVERRALLD